MKDTNTLDVASNAAQTNRNGIGTPILSQNRAPGNLERKRGIMTDEDETEDEEEKEHEALKKRFVAKLTEYQLGQKSLVDVVREMIDADVERDEAIDWAVEAGFSKSYARATVSTLYSALIGRGKKDTVGARETMTPRSLETKS